METCLEMSESNHGKDVEVYEDNSGTTLAIRGKDFCVVAADTRHSAEYNINTRRATKVFPIDGRILLSVAGFYADGRHVWERLRSTVEKYQFDYNRKMDVQQIAAALHIILYENRFFPKYAYCCVSGFDEEGHPRVFSFDPTGSYQETDCRCYGSGMRMLQPLIDSRVGKKNWGCEEGKHDPLTLEYTLTLVRDVFSSAAETDVKTGDAIELYIIRREGLQREVHPLRDD